MSKANANSPVPMIKLEKFTATEFNDWKLNTQFGMKYLNVFYTVQTNYADFAGTVDEDQWVNDEDFCRDYLLNCLSSRLAKTYLKMKTAKEIWDALEAHFKQEEDLSKAHLVDKFNAFTFDEEKEILPQVSDFEHIVDLLLSENLPLPDGFVAGTIIYKLPAAWYNFKTEMYRKKVQVSLNDLKRFIRIEDENRTRHALEVVNKQKTVANMITNSKRMPNPKKTKPSTSSPQVAGPNKKIKKFKGKCFNCNKWGHSAAECRLPKKEKSKGPQEGNQANMVSHAEPSNFVAMVGTVKASKEWYLDSGATCHVCNNANLLTGLTDAKETVTVANGETAEVLKVGTATLVLSSGDLEMILHGGKPMHGCMTMKSRPFDAALSSSSRCILLNNQSLTQSSVKNWCRASFYSQSFFLKGAITKIFPNVSTRASASKLPLKGSTLRRNLMVPRASKSTPFSYRYPPMTKKPRWWWRTLACIPYFMPLNMTWMYSETAYHLHPFLGDFELLTYPFQRILGTLPKWFLIVYFAAAYALVVRRKEWPHFIRFHVIMGMLCEMSLQVVGTISHWMPLGVYWGKFGMHFWTGFTFAYLFTVLECLRCALGGMYADVPFVSDAAYFQLTYD